MPTSKNNVDFIVAVKDKFSSGLKKFNSLITTTTKIVAAAAVGLGLVAAAAFAWTAQVAASNDKVAQFAGRIGVSVEALSAYQFAANQSGVANEQLNLSWQRMTRRVAEAAQGMGEAQGALKELGLDAKELAKLSVDKQFEEMARSLDTVENQADKVRLAFKLFDSEGVAVLQMLEDGSEGLQQMTADAERYGAVISTEAAANSALFTDNLGKLKIAATSVVDTLSERFMPLITGGMKRMADVLADNREEIVAFAVAGIKWIGALAEDTARAIAFSIDTFREWQLIISEVKISFTEFVLDSQDEIDTWVLGTKKLLEATNFLGVFDGALESLDKFTADAPERLAGLEQAIAVETEKIQATLAKGFAIDKVEANILRIKQTLQELTVEGTAEAEDPAESPEVLTVNAIQEEKAAILALWREEELTSVENFEKAQTDITKKAEKARMTMKSATVDATLGFINRLGRESKTAAVAGVILGAAKSAANVLQTGATAAQLAFASQLTPGDSTSPARGAVAAAQSKAFTALQLGIIAANATLDIAGQAHDGFTSLPSSGSFSMLGGERVVAPRQNEDLTSFLSDQNNKEASPSSVTYNFNFGDIFPADYNEFVRDLAEFTQAAERDGLDLLGAQGAS